MASADDELAEMRAKLDEIIAHLNKESMYQVALHSGLNTFVKHYIARWYMWIRRIPLPTYERKVIEHIGKRDRTPTARNHTTDASQNGGAPQNGDTQPRTQRGKVYRRDNI